MDYEEKYNQAFERAKKSYNKAIKEGWTCDKCIYEEIFPELKESDDERIRKEILDYIDKSTGCERWVAWLEKQGEQKKSYDTCNSSMMNNKKSPIGEKRDFGYFEEKSADKVEPKFKVGDWILYSGDHYEGVRHITKIDEDGYYIERNGLPHGIIPFNHEICMRLWTIQDAKEGDVLVDPLSGDIQITILFKCIELDTSIRAYCGWNCYNFRVTTDGTGYGTLSSTKYVPATKEQRDLLFQEMEKAGYEWNDSTKELKKINSYCQENCKGYQETGKCFADGECKAKRETEQNPAWSEEDEEILITIFSYFKVDLECTDEDDIVKWLKSLKNRVQPQQKQELSEEDEEIIDDLIQTISQYTVFAHREPKEIIQWLKSLNPQSHWKPTEEQMQSLYFAIITYSKKDDCKLTYDGLNSLYDDLKKL